MPEIPAEAPKPESAPQQKGVPSGRGASLVAAGILISRLLGLVRERVLAHYFGTSMVSAAFRAALRIPNFLQNLFGEGVLSASFIPVYAGLLGRNERDEADRVAGAVFGLLGLVISLLVVAGVLFTRVFIDTIASGFQGETRELAIHLVRIAFPGTGFLVMSAWCLGVLNSHRRFFLSYVAPVAWNIVIIACLLAFGPSTPQVRLAEYVSYAAVLGSLLQFAVQVPTVLTLLGRFRPTVSTSGAPTRQVLRSFGPVVVSRGVVQISAYVDLNYASRISTRAFSNLGYAQTLYLLPISLFGMAISAAELPEMSRATGTPEEVHQQLRERITVALERVAFFVVPSVIALFVLGDIVGGALLQGGHFRAADTRYLWYLLMGSTVGLLAATNGRLYSSAFYALKDTRTPLYFATARVGLTAVLAYWSAVKLPGQLGVPQDLGGVGITATTGVAAWIEFLLLRWRLTQRIGPTRVNLLRMSKIWLSGALAGGLGLAIKVALTRTWGPMPGADQEWGGGHFLPPALSPILTALVILTPFGVSYFGLTFLAGVPQSRAVLSRIVTRILRVAGRR